jgi:hypothetical protein
MPALQGCSHDSYLMDSTKGAKATERVMSLREALASWQSIFYKVNKSVHGE